MDKQTIEKWELSRSFWNTFRELLDEYGITQKDFCEEIGIKEKTLSAMINRNSCPNIYFLRKINEVFGTDYTYLIDNEIDDREKISLSYKERVVLSLLRNGTEDENNRNLNAIAAMLKLQRGECLTSLDELNNVHYSGVFNEFGLVEPDKQAHLFEFLEDFDLRKKDIENGGDGYVYPEWATEDNTSLNKK